MKIDSVFHKGKFIESKPHGFDWKGCKTNPDFEIITTEVSDDLKHDEWQTVETKDGKRELRGVALGIKEPVVETVEEPIVLCRNVVDLKAI